MLAPADVHITADGVIVLYHDSLLGRTTTGSGRVNEQNYWGTLEHVRTVQEPVQKIPTFNELCDFLMQPEYQHVKANVRLFVSPILFSIPSMASAKSID